MPLPLAAIAAGTQIAGNVAGPILQGVQNRKNRKFAKEMYQMQRNDALADWHMQNEYNSPAAQMKRYTDAGLNPNLIYGQSNEAAAVRSTSADVPDGKAPEIKTDGILAYQAVQMQQAQLDNVRQAIEVAKQEQLLKAAQTAKVVTETDTGSFELDMKQSLKDVSLEAARTNLEQQLQSLDNSRLAFDKTVTDIGAVRATTQSTLDANERAAISQPVTIQEALERILTMRLQRSKTELEKRQIEAQVDQLKQDTHLKSFEEVLKATGTAESPFFIKTLMRMLENLRNKSQGKSTRK